jgi:RNA polymerase sigma-70 factor, ECF subfamily
MSEYRDKTILRWYEEFNEPIFKFIFMMIQDYQQAEDLRHETFIKAYVKYDSYQGQSSAKTWLFSIAHNLTIDFLRKRKPIILFKEVFLSKKDENPLPDELVQIKESSYELYKALGAIKDTYREVIILRKIKEFSIEETATILGWSESKVKSSLYRAIRALEKEMLKEGQLHEKTIRRYV